MEVAVEVEVDSAVEVESVWALVAVVAAVDTEAAEAAVEEEEEAEVATKPLNVETAKSEKLTALAVDP